MWDLLSYIELYCTDPDVLDDMSEWRDPVNDINNQVIGVTEVLLDGNRQSCRLRECNMGKYMHYIMAT